MIIDGTVSSNKSQILVDKYADLLNSGVDASKVLVLVANAHVKNSFIEATLKQLKINSFEKLLVHSFSSLIYNTINDNWAFIENKNPFPNPKILPNLTGLEVSQFILKDILKTVPFKGYNSKKSLLHQLFRRYGLIVQNNLSDDDIDYRSQILEEAFAPDAKIALKKFLKQTLYLRDFDYLRQCLVFEHIYQNTTYFSNIEYLILDDGDEITPACYKFIEHLKPQLKDWVIAFDKNGSSRIGYLSADKTAVWEFEKLFNESAKSIETTTQLKYDATAIYDNVLNDTKNDLEYFVQQSPSKRSKMIELVVNKINSLIQQNIKPSEIAIITPVIDEMLKSTLKENLDKHINPLYLVGNEKLIQNKLVLTCLNILKLNSNLKSFLTEFDIRSVLTNCLNIPLKYCEHILSEFDKNKTLISYNFNNECYDSKYKKLIDLTQNVLPKQKKLSEQVYTIYSELIDFKSYEKNEIIKFNFFIKQLEDFENVFGNDFENRKEDIITQIENSIIAENPYSTTEISEMDLIIGTPQKIIDNQIKTKFQLWLDTSSNEWTKSDTGPLYNAWVFQKGWNKDQYTIEDNIQLSKEKTARILRKLTLCAKEKVYTYSSLFDGNGVENFGGIEEFIITKSEDIPETKADTTTFKIYPRDDQKPVLEYKKNKMAISAVPGAGKTTILLALIIKLLDSGINPKNIFVMTYMESAARNFRERIKSIKEESFELPYISTIHGLALRILKENSNFERLGLNSDFDICDDTQKNRIIREVTKKFKIDNKELNEYIQGISVFKLGRGNFDNLKTTKSQKLLNFRTFYNEYQNILSANNLIDYDDILIMAVKLLEENADIKKHYQEICQYIIEDEAQDSSSVQQSLINILGGKYQNIIRCGDINQAITTTFTNADINGFRKFIENADTQVKMDCSQRCAEDVWKLANTLLLDSETDFFTKNAFYHLIMKPVTGRNPISPNAVVTNISQTPSEEKNYILKELKSYFNKNPKATVGILVRNNKQVVDWTNFINNSGLKCITRSECLEQKSIYRVIHAVLKIILYPFDNNIVANSYEILSELGLYKNGCSDTIRKTPYAFINSNPDENKDLSQFLWDINYWIGFPHLSVDELAIKIGLYYFDGEIEKSNIYLISTLIKRLSFETRNISTIIQNLEELAKRNSLSGFKFFSEEDEDDKGILEGKVQIMTLHKSKGDEFDVVFLPEMTEYNLTININKLKYKPSDFMEQLKALNSNYKIKKDTELKQEIVAENLRLLYVAITRAKKKLYITTSEKVKAFGKYKKEEPNKIFDIINNSERTLKNAKN